MRRVSVARLAALAEGMSERDRQIVETVARLRLVNGDQLSRLFFHDGSTAATSARRARRVLARLVEQRSLARLERRSGGSRGGSASWVYALGPAGGRLVAYWTGEGLPRSRSVHEPGALWTAHTLAISDLYVRLLEAERAGRIELLAFDAEPACWRTFTKLGGVTGRLKPDAFVRIGVGDFEDVFFVEVDMASEHRGQLARQHRAYADYFRSGVEQAQAGVFPSVLWLAPDERRAALIWDVKRRLSEPAPKLFRVGTHARALDALCGEDLLDDPDEGDES